MKYTVGLDPEFFLLRRQDDGFASSLAYLPVQEEAIKLPNGSTIYSDNVLAELTVPPVTIGGGNLESQLIGVLQDTFYHAHEHLKQHDLKLGWQSSAVLPDAVTDSAEAWEFGCNPEYCAWEIDEFGQIQMVEINTPTVGNNLRTAGGHIHFGHERALEYPIQAIRLMDLYIGLPCVLLDQDPTSARRKNLYGGAGFFRSTEYGVEYRTLSNFWTASHSLVGTVCMLVDEVARNLERDPEKIMSKDFPGKSVREVINTHDKVRAWELWHELLRSEVNSDIRMTLEQQFVYRRPSPSAEWGFTVTPKDGWPEGKKKTLKADYESYVAKTVPAATTNASDWAFETINVGATPPPTPAPLPRTRRTQPRSRGRFARVRPRTDQ